MTNDWLPGPGFLPESPWGWAILLLAAFLLYRRFTARHIGKAVGNFKAAARMDAPATVTLAGSDVELKRNLSALDLAEGATYEQVKAAYRELVKIWHPDRFANDIKLKARANAKLIEINAAYEKLKTHFER